MRRLTDIELRAAWLACSNYTPHKGPWKQAAQSRAVSKMGDEILRREFKKIGKSYE